MRECCATELLDVLAEGPKTTSQLVQVNHRFSASVCVLRKQGWTIYEGKTDSGESLWSLGSRTEMVEVTDEMKAAYYTSEHWKTRRADRLRYDSHQCCLCRMRFCLQVHHWKYELFAEQLKDLCTLCEPCHEAIHKNEHIRIHFPHYVTPEVGQRLESLVTT